jgi:3'-5' exonuclease
MPTPVLVFDIETVPDVAGLRRLWEIDAAVSDDAVVELVSQRRRQATGSDFLPTHLQRIVAISCVLRAGAETLRVWSVGTLEDGERDIVKRFFEGVEKYVPTLVTWNGSSFDLPVLHYRALFHGVPASTYWDLGEENKEFKWNNYISRWHLRHTDLMDVLAGYQNRAWAPLNEIAVLCGLPGKLGMDGSQVWPAYKRGELEAIRNYCETDVANTYLLYLRFQLMRGVIDPAAYEREVALFRAFLAEQTAPHWKEFATAWR